MRMVTTRSGNKFREESSPAARRPSDLVDKSLIISGREQTYYPDPVKYGRVGTLGGVKPDKFKYTGEAGGTYFAIGDESGIIAAKSGLTLNDPDECPYGATSAIVTAFQNGLAVKPRIYKSLKMITSSDADQFNNYSKFLYIDDTGELREVDLSAYIQAASNPMAQNDKVRELTIEFDNVVGSESAFVFKVDNAETLTALFTPLVK